jgi:hypothetical protein
MAVETVAGNRRREARVALFAGQAHRGVLPETCKGRNNNAHQKVGVVVRFFQPMFGCASKI